MNEATSAARPSVLTDLARQLLSRQTASWTANALGVDKRRLVDDATAAGGSYDHRTDRVTLPQPRALTDVDRVLALAEEHATHPHPRLAAAAQRLVTALEEFTRWQTRARRETEALAVPAAIVRAWANAYGIEVGHRGLVKLNVRMAYLDDVQARPVSAPTEVAS